jgi:hypothetical protein
MQVALVCVGRLARRERRLHLHPLLHHVCKARIHQRQSRERSGPDHQAAIERTHVPMGTHRAQETISARRPAVKCARNGLCPTGPMARSCVLATSYVVKYRHPAGPLPTNATPKPNPHTPHDAGTHWRQHTHTHTHARTHAAHRGIARAVPQCGACGGGRSAGRRALRPAAWP